jgi:hypothetical protein
LFYIAFSTKKYEADMKRPLKFSLGILGVFLLIGGAIKLKSIGGVLKSFSMDINWDKGNAARS